MEIRDKYRIVGAPVPSNTNSKLNENDLFALLVSNMGKGEVSVGLDLPRLAHMDSPICVDAEKSRWIYGIMAASLGSGLGVTWQAGLAALVLGVALYIGLGRSRIRRRMTDRFYNQTLENISDFKKLWRLRGVTLTHVARAVDCRSPNGDWRRFVLDHLQQHSDLALDGELT